MPQFEFKEKLTAPTVVRIRARNQEDAVAKHLGLSDGLSVDFVQGADFSVLSGWEKVVVEGESVGYVRPYDRMQFRRA